MSDIAQKLKALNKDLESEANALESAVWEMIGTLSEIAELLSNSHQIKVSHIGSGGGLDEVIVPAADNQSTATDIDYDALVRGMKMPPLTLTPRLSAFVKYATLGQLLRDFSKLSTVYRIEGIGRHSVRWLLRAIYDYQDTPDYQWPTRDFTKAEHEAWNRPFTKADYERLKG